MLKNFSLFTFTIFILTSCSQLAPYSDKNYIRTPATFQSCFQEMSAFFKPIQESGASSSKVLYEVESLDELEATYANKSFITIQQELAQIDIEKNNKNLSKLLSLPLPAKDLSDRTSYITLEEAKILFNDVQKSKVNKNHYCYDPEGKVGFCFGRATITHMEALARGVSADSIKKIWIAGDMKEWGHHVATIIKAEDGWYVIDTVVGKVIKADEWANVFKPQKTKNAKDIMVFVSSAERFGPYDNSTYSAMDLFNTATDEFDKSSDFYKGYFHDYFDDLDKKDGIKKFPIR